MQDYREIAKEFKNQGITTIPVKADKQPTINWINYQTKPLSDEEIDRYFAKCFGIAVVTGGPGHIECLDFDLKYDLSHDLMDRFKEKVPHEILEKMWVQKTMSGGYHWLYKTNIAEPNQKLASRYTTAYEKHETYMEAFNDPSLRDKAWKIVSGDKSRVLIETRGGIITGDKRIGKGYFLVAPTPGYEYIYGQLQELTDGERNALIATCREFNETNEMKADFRLNKFRKEGDVDVFKWYNEEGDALGLLYEYGWTLYDSKGKNYRLKRPGKPASTSSALFDAEKRKMTVFSTSGCFETNRGYSPVDIFLELECDNDPSVCYQKLLNLYECQN